MKAQYKIMGMVIASMISTYAFADSLHKDTSRIDFNKMIDENNSEKTELHKSVEGTMDTTDAVPDADQKKVLDLVDVEIGVGQDRPVVDRRYNSIGDAQVDPRFSNNAQVQLVEDKKTDSGT